MQLIIYIQYLHWVGYLSWNFHVVLILVAAQKGKNLSRSDPKRLLSPKKCLCGVCPYEKRLCLIESALGSSNLGVQVS